MTLYAAETAKVTVTDGTISNGTGLSVTVKVAAQKALQYVTTSAGTTDACPTGEVKVGNGGHLTAFVAVLDNFGNLTNNGASALSITITKVSGGGNAPSPASLTVLANATPAVTSASTELKIPTGNPTPSPYTASSGSLTSVTCTVGR
jgi:hypothetical protein